MKSVRIKTMERSQNWICEASYRIVWCHHMTHGPFRPEGNKAVPICSLDKMCSGKTFTKAVIDLVICCHSLTKESRNAIYCIISRRYLKLSSRRGFSKPLHFESCVLGKQKQCLGQLEKPPWPFNSSTLRCSAFDGPGEPFANTLCKLPEK